MHQTPLPTSSVTIRRIEDNDVLHSNHRLRTKFVPLTTSIFKGHRPDGDGWEPIFEVTTTMEANRSRVKVNPSKKQRAARAVRPINIVQVSKMDCPKTWEEVDQRLEVMHLREEVAARKAQLAEDVVELVSVERKNEEF